MKHKVNKVEIRKILSQNIKYYRRKNKMSQSVLAKKTKFSLQTIKNLEVFRRWGTSMTIMRISKALGVEAWKLFIPRKEKTNG